MAWDWVATAATGVVGVVGVAGTLAGGVLTQRAQSQMTRDTIGLNERAELRREARTVYAKYCDAEQALGVAITRRAHNASLTDEDVIATWSTVQITTYHLVALVSHATGDAVMELTSALRGACDVPRGRADALDIILQQIAPIRGQLAMAMHTELHAAALS